MRGEKLRMALGYVLFALSAQVNLATEIRAKKYARHVAGQDTPSVKLAPRKLRSRVALDPGVAQGYPGNGNGLLHLGQNQPQVVMRGLDPRIHAVVGAASGRCAGVDAHGSSPWAEGPRIKSGHDDLELCFRRGRGRRKAENPA